MKEHELNEGENDMRCTRCGKYVSQLTPYKVEDTKGRITVAGNRLVRNFRELDLVEYHEQSEIILKEMRAGKTVEELVKIYGHANVDAAGQYDYLTGYVEDSWECIDCIKESGDFRRYEDK